MSDDPFITDKISRRQWMLRLGEAVALTGFSGLAPELAGLLRDDAPQPELPPGLYLPSTDLMVHALSGGHKTLTPPVGSETDYAQPSPGPFRPQFFSADEFEIVTRLVTIVLGEVTPAALSQAAQWVDLWFHSSAEVRQAARDLDPLHRVLAVQYYGQSAVSDLETTDPQAIAREGIAALGRLSDNNTGQAFLELDAEEQMKVIATIRAAKRESVARRFFDLLRGEAIRGYFTSPEGLAELNYTGNAYYGECPGCAISHPDHAGERR
jgi:hypothetical protein